MTMTEQRSGRAPGEGERPGAGPSGGAGQQGGTGQHGGSGQAVRLQVRLTPESSVPGFYARVSGGRLDMPIEFSDKGAFLRFLQRVAESGPGLK